MPNILTRQGGRHLSHPHVRTEGWECFPSATCLALNSGCRYAPIRTTDFLTNKPINAGSLCSHTAPKSRQSSGVDEPASP